MTDWQLKLVLIAAGGVLAVVGLYRLTVWMENRGWVRLRNLDSRNAAAGGLGPLREAFEPEARQVVRVGEQKQTESDAAGDPPDPSAANRV